MSTGPNDERVPVGEMIPPMLAMAVRRKDLSAIDVASIAGVDVDEALNFYERDSLCSLEAKEKLLKYLGLDSDLVSGKEGSRKKGHFSARPTCLSVISELQHP